MDRKYIDKRCAVHLTKTKHPRYNWRVYFSDPIDGKRKDKNFRTKGDAVDWIEGGLLELVEKADKGAKGEFTFRNALVFYREQASIGINGRAPVGSSYIGNLERYERLQLADCPFLDDPIDGTSEEDCFRYMRTLREKQTEVAANAAKYMKAATELAKQEFQCSTDPLKDARTPPKRSKTKRETNKQILSRAQVRALLDYFRNKRLATKRVAFQKSFHRTELSLSLAAMTGMRIGEIAALRLENIDLKTCSLDVIHAFKGEDGIGKPKTEAGVRSIPFDQTLADRISEYCEMWKVNSGLLLARDSGKAIDRHNIQRSIKAAVEELGLPPTGMHGLRHYYVSCLIAAGVDAKTIIYRTGHKDYAFTVRLYGHLMIEQDEKPFVVVV